MYFFQFRSAGTLNPSPLLILRCCDCWEEIQWGRSESFLYALNVGNRFIIFSLLQDVFLQWVAFLLLNLLPFIDCCRDFKDNNIVRRVLYFVIPNERKSDRTRQRSLWNLTMVWGISKEPGLRLKYGHHKQGFVSLADVSQQFYNFRISPANLYLFKYLQ